MKHECMDGCTAWMDGWMDGWIEGWRLGKVILLEAEGMAKNDILRGCPTKSKL